MVARAGRTQRLDVIERGAIHIAYRRRAETDDIRSLDDVERFYLILTPDGGDRRSLFRIVTIGRKHPSPAGSDTPQRFWGLVTRIAETAAQVAQELGREELLVSAPPRPRIRPAAAPCGGGVYCIARHGDHTHLAHAFDATPGDRPLLGLIGIDPEADYLLIIKNPSPLSRRPAAPAPRQPPPPAYPAPLQRHFRHRLYIAPETTEFLDFEGTQLLLLGLGDRAAADPDAAADLGISLDPNHESAAAAGLHAALAATREENPPAPLLRSG